MKPEEFTPAWQPSKNALPGEGAWMSSGAKPPKLSKQFTEEARRLSQEKQPSKEQIAQLADRYEDEVREEHQAEARRRSNALVRRGSRGPLPKEPQRPDLHPDLVGALAEPKEPKDSKAVPSPSPKSSKESQRLSRRGSNDSRTSVSVSDGGPQRKSIHEILSKNPQLKADVDRLKSPQLGSEKRGLDPANATDRAVLDDLFLCYDPNGDGTGSLSFREFNRLVKALGLRLSKSEVEGMMKQLDESGNGLIEIDEFAFFFNHAGARNDMKANAESMEGSKNKFVRKLFEEFKDPSGRGLTLEGLKLLVKASPMGTGKDKLTPKEIDLFFKRLDTSDTGFLLLDDLLYIFDNYEVRFELREVIESVGASNSELLSLVFEKFDSESEGHMNKFDLLAAARLLGHKVTQSSVDTLLAKVDTDGNGTVELDEFLEFFEQVRSAEELAEDLENFKKLQVRQKYKRDFGLALGVALLLGGIYGTVFISDPFMFAVGVPALLSGAVLISTVILPKVPALVYGFSVKQCKAMTPEKLCFINMFMFMSIALFYLRQSMSGNANTASHFAVRILGAGMLLGCLLEMVWLACRSTGWTVSEVDSEMAEEDRAGQKAYLAQAAALESGRSPVSTRGSPGKRSSDTDVTISTRASRDF